MKRLATIAMFLVFTANVTDAQTKIELHDRWQIQSSASAGTDGAAIFVGYV
jgi:hypothetical protein